jgi:hypothetical protein
MTPLSDNCPECGGKLRGGHAHPCCIGTLEGVCGSCFGDGLSRGGTLACPACGGDGRAKPGTMDAAAVTLAGVDAQTRRICAGKDEP